MKYLKLTITVVVFTLAIQFSQAQEIPSLENSVLWKIEHSDLKEPSYLLGTLHFMCEEDFSISEKVQRTLKTIDALVLEVNIGDPEEMNVMMKAMKNSKKISEQLSEWELKQIDSLSQKELGLPIINFDDYGLSIFNSILMSKMLPCTSLKYLENELTQLAVANNKSVYGIEKVQEQMEYIEKAYPTDYAFEQIMLFESYKKDFNNSIESYKNEELNQAVKLLRKKSYMNENAIKYLLSVRNNNWIDRMPEMMAKESNLFAFGAAHLTNENGIIHLLRQKGYTITPVLN